MNKPPHVVLRDEKHILHVGPQRAQAAVKVDRGPAIYAPAAFRAFDRAFRGAFPTSTRLNGWTPELLNRK